MKNKEAIVVQSRLKTLAVICASKAEYVAHIEKDLVPILEGYHDVKFLKNHADHSYKAPGFHIFRLKKADQLKGLGNYQLVKIGKFYEHPEIEKIEELYKLEVSRRMPEV